MNVLNSKAGMIGVGVLAAGAVLYFFGRKVAGAAGDAAGAVVDAISNVNAGTPYEGYGAIGTLGNAANAVSGGAFQRWGESLGGAIFNVFHKPYDPNNPNTPALRKAASAASPVRAEDALTIFAR